MPSTKQPRALCFHNNTTGDEGAVAISASVKRSGLLEDFQCSSAGVESEGGGALSEAPGMCPHLTKIDGQGNVFGIQAGLTLSKSISKYAGTSENLTRGAVTTLILAQDELKDGYNLDQQGVRKATMNCRKLI
ncbi:hypothetical protein RJ639_035161 [Escallonia herrerae]|uniref:Uncharacterized protein n=1 Tax=Escallonia herrerae TaxID=1293975 RepID=A0AA89BDD1_9ASTE|nr:hypothetical protein RJ639_035161 [Escallonia herrerae]